MDPIESKKRQLSTVSEVTEPEKTTDDTAAAAAAAETESPLSTKNMQKILPINLKQKIDEISLEDEAQPPSPILHSRRSIQESKTTELPGYGPALFCSNMKRTPWGLCYVPKPRVKKVSEDGTVKFKAPVVAFKDNQRFLDSMNLGKNTTLKILIVGHAAEGGGVKKSLEEAAEKKNITSEIALSSDPSDEDMAAQFFIFLFSWDNSTGTRMISALISKMEKRTANLIMKSVLLVLPSASGALSGTSSLIDIQNFKKTFQMCSYNWPRVTDRCEIFCDKLLALAKDAKSAINWGLLRPVLNDEED